MPQRVGVLSARPLADGRLRLLTPSGEEFLVAADAAEEELKLYFQLDKIVRMPPIDFCATINLDGPLAGTTGYAINRIGYRVSMALRAGPGAPTATYELVKISQDDQPAELRYVPAESGPVKPSPGPA